MTKEQIIQNYMKSLEISREEAEQLYEDDKEDFIGEEGEKLQAKANQVKPKADRKKKVSKPKERKVDTEKLEILTLVKNCLEQNGYEVELEKEIAIHFGEYTLKLTRHRPPKK